MFIFGVELQVIKEIIHKPILFSILKGITEIFYYTFYFGIATFYLKMLL